jgi:SAM-dependent methyltransferase
MAKEDWFKSWFDTSYYHMLYEHRDSTDAQIFMDVLINHLKLNKGDRVLDLACGRGRHALYLHKKGFDVKGIDLSKRNIAFARQQIPSVDFEIKDMRENFGDAEFDYIFNLFTSFGYFDIRQQHLEAVKNMALALKPNGVLVLDFMNAHKVHRGLVEDELIDSDNVSFRVKRYVEDEKIVKEIFVKEDEKELRYFEKVALLTLQDFEGLFEQAKLKVIKTFGDFNLNPYSEEQSDRLILMAQRA